MVIEARSMARDRARSPRPEPVVQAIGRQPRLVLEP